MPSKPTGVSAALAALGSLFAAGSCCLPVGTLFAAAGAAGASALLRDVGPWLMPFAAILVALGFYQLYGRGVRPPLWSQLLLWMSALAVSAVFLFPQRIAILIARLTG
ncbi:MAG: hypothetical protein JNL98_29570 [Bryobacterales bacterium]|nr:hypothetical protein [Bryobacterales bacterium]